MLNKHAMILRDHLPLTLGTESTIAPPSAAYVILDAIFQAEPQKHGLIRFRIKVAETEYMVTRRSYEFNVKNIGSNVYEVSTPFADLFKPHYDAALTKLRDRLIEEYRVSNYTVHIRDLSVHYQACLALFVEHADPLTAVVTTPLEDDDITWQMSYNIRTQCFILRVLYSPKHTRAVVLC